MHDLTFHALKKLPVIFLILVYPNLLFAQADTLWYAHRAFGEGRYDDAINAYQAAIDEGSTWNWLPDLIETVQIRKELGEIAPPDTHRIMVIYVVQLNEITGPDTITTEDVTPEQKETWRIYFNVFRKTIESFSAGNWTVNFDSINAVSTYRTGSNLKPDNPDHLDLGDEFFRTMADYDSYITFSNTRSPAMGLARQYPYINGVLYGPHRGMAAINAGTHGYGILLHEFFHIVEWVSNAISPTHGFENGVRDNFPGWTGNTEFDYYRWHFSETLPAVGWSRLNHRTRWIPFHNSESDLGIIRSAYQLIPLEDRQKADTLYKNGKALIDTDPDQAATKWEEAVSLSPYHTGSLVELYDYYRFINKDESRAGELYDDLKIIRSAGDFYTVDTVNTAYGDVIALWHREDVGHNWAFHKWDLTSFIRKSGCYDLTFYYTGGYKALDTDSVSLEEDGVPVSFDAHMGFSGNNKTDITYHLGIPDYKPGSSYMLKARIKGDGGVDSYGQIHAIFTSDSCAVPDITTGLIDEETLPEIDFYPNPAHSSVTIAGAGGWYVEITDYLGRIYAGQDISGNQEKVGLSLQKGVYLIRLSATGEKPQVRRLVIR